MEVHLIQLTKQQYYNLLSVQFQKPENKDIEAILLQVLCSSKLFAPTTFLHTKPHRYSTGMTSESSVVLKDTADLGVPSNKGCPPLPPRHDEEGNCGHPPYQERESTAANANK